MPTKRETKREAKTIQYIEIISPTAGLTREDKKLTKKEVETITKALPQNRAYILEPEQFKIAEEINPRTKKHRV